jgi:CarD family transcriptional regulator
MRFEIGDAVMVSGCGLGSVEAIESVPVDGGDPNCSATMYRITFPDTKFRTWIPTDRPEGSARPVMSGEAAEAALAALAHQGLPEERVNWRQRYLRYQQTVKDNDPHQLAALLGELAVMRAERPLSFQERRLFDRLKHLVLPEIAVARGVATAEVEEVLARVLDASVRAA